MRGIISQQVVDGLVPAVNDVFLWDEDIPGFGLKVTPAGRRVYMFQYRIGGRAARTNRITIGREGQGWTAEMARKEAGRLRDQVNRGEDPKSAPGALNGKSKRAVAEQPPRVASRDADWRIVFGYLLNDISRLQGVALRRTMRSLGGSQAQWAMLGRLSTVQGVTQSELAEMLDLGKVALSGLVERAERAGWIERRADENDRRLRRLYLTKKAKQAIGAMRAKVDAMYDVTLDGVTEGEGQRFIAILETARSRLLPLARPRG